MASENIIQSITDCAREFDVGALWLFGSALGDMDGAGDIDLAVEGLAPEKFFSFYGRLLKSSPKPVDLVDLSQNPPIRHIVREKGRIIYERRK